MDVLRVSNLRFAWPAWHFVTCGRLWQRVENRFSWQAQYFCKVFKTCVTFFVAGAALQTCRVACFSQIALARLRALATTCKFRGKRGISWHVSKLEEVLHEMLVLRFARVALPLSGCAELWGKLQCLTFENVSKCENSWKSRTKCSF